MYPNLGISKTSMSIMNSMVLEVYEKVTKEASKLVKYNKKKTLNAQGI